ncbi:hypothetical protein SESBI_13809 [Sesbania bispinosa]|nr:hypothetical protein SESBI_13809 [Sesbania bispinosa]
MDLIHRSTKKIKVTPSDHTENLADQNPSPAQEQEEVHEESEMAKNNSNAEVQKIPEKKVIQIRDPKAGKNSQNHKTDGNKKNSSSGIVKDSGKGTMIPKKSQATNSKLKASELPDKGKFGAEKGAIQL